MSSQEAGGPSATEYRSPYLSGHFVALQRQQRQQQLQQYEQQRRQNLFGAFFSEDDASDGMPPPPFPYYPEGPISDLVYPVNGGLEDWAYSAAFQQSPTPISTCLVPPSRGPRRATETNGDDTTSRTMALESSPRRLAGHGGWWRFFDSWDPMGTREQIEESWAGFDRSGVRCAMYLVETHDHKNPPAREYGTVFFSSTCGFGAA